MNSWLTARAALGLLLCVVALPSGANAQTNPGNIPLKEVQVAQDAFSLGDPIPAWVDPVAMPEAGTSQPLVMRLADTQILVDGTPVTYVHRALTINDPASLTAAGQLPIPFVPQYQRLQLHAIHVLRGQEVLDRTASSTIRFLQRETGLEQGIYSDVVTASILVNDLRAGDTLEYIYSVHGQNPVFGGKFFDSVTWDQAYPTALRRVVLNYPSGRQIAWRALGDSRAQSLVPRESTQGGMRKLLFEEPSMAEVHPEPLAPPDYMSYRWLQFSEFSGWDEVAAWANGLFQVDGALEDDLRDVVAKLRARPTDEERAAAALEFVQGEIRYFAILLGESSHRPTNPNLVLKRRYGDCKDKSFLLITLLKELGIASRPVLLNIGLRKGLDQSLPTPQVFDHVIVQASVDGHEFYLDPTRLGQHGRLSRMGQAHEGAQVLLVAPETKELSTISSANVAELTRDELSETAVLPKLAPEGQLKFRQVSHGVAAETVRVLIEHLPHAQTVKLIGDAMERRYPGARMVGEPQIEDDRVNNVMSIAAAYDVPKLAMERDGNWAVRYVPGNLLGALISAPSSTRTAPLRLARFPLDASYSFEVQFPAEVTSVADPRAETVQDKYFVYKATSAFRGNVSKTTVELKTLADRVEVQDLGKYGEDLQAADNVVKGVVFVGKNEIKSSAASEEKSFAQVLRDRLQDVVDKTSETIKSGKLTGNDLAAAYCARGSAQSDLGKADDALRDANEALKLAPNATKLLFCRAEIYFQAGAFGKSVADYARAITLGATGPEAFHHRGISAYYAGNLDDAADDLARASEANGYESQLYSDLWLIWTCQRLGRPIPDGVAKRAAAEPRGDWPRPALAMLTGNLAPDDMLKLIDGKTGDDRHMALAEGYFYLGQHFLMLGDKAKAREYFEKTRQLEVIIYTEHIAAAFELQHLKEEH
jgi:lipoprotein NlpI/transglutaminase-like putative cysteine protease